MRHSSLNYQTLRMLLLLLPVLPGARAQTQMWRTGYFTPWARTYNMPPSNIDYDALTHIVQVAACPLQDGSLDSGCQGQLSPALVQTAHAYNKKVLICISNYGSSSETQWLSATKPANLPKLISAILTLVSANNYDGVDIDWEPLKQADITQYSTLIRQLRIGLGSNRLLTAAASSLPTAYTSLYQYLDQLNIMTYDLAGTWDAPLTWHNAALYSGTYEFPSLGVPVGSVERTISQFIAAGVPSNRLGLGLPFYGYIWQGGVVKGSSGVTRPMQTYTGSVNQSQILFNDLMNNYYATTNPSWDPVGQVPFLSFRSGQINSAFISYDDALSIAAKVRYAISKGLGGLMIWDLAGDYFPAFVGPQEHPLSNAIKEVLRPGTLSMPICPAPYINTYLTQGAFCAQ